METAAFRQVSTHVFHAFQTVTYLRSFRYRTNGLDRFYRRDLRAVYAGKPRLFWGRHDDIGIRTAAHHVDHGSDAALQNLCAPTDRKAANRSNSPKRQVLIWGYLRLACRTIRQQSDSPKAALDLPLPAASRPCRIYGGSLDPIAGYQPLPSRAFTIKMCEPLGLFFLTVFHLVLHP